jgi:thiol-disulfide isomerase/thioredoxin
MKKYSSIFLILFFTSFTSPKTIITFSGKIVNTENSIITIKGELFSTEIKLNPDGSFSEKLTLDYEGIYVLETTKNSLPIYFSNDSKIVITADDANFNGTLKYTGIGSIENQYIAKKLIITSQISDEELYRLDETEFLNKMVEIKTAVSALYNKTEFSNDYFKGKEFTNIHNLEQKHLLFYKYFHNWYAHLNNFVVSEKFPKYDEKIDLDNESDFVFSNDYKNIVLLKFFEKIKGDGINPMVSAKDAIPEIKALKSQSIKNRLIQNGISDINIQNSNYENTYKEFISITNDPKIIETLTINFKNVKMLETGNPSPTFIYENYEGGKTALESLRGNYVYIDVWATWCGPCIQEIPFLQKVEEQYAAKKIVFVSISIDNTNDREKWRNFVNKKQLEGIQLLADNLFDSKFIREYGIQGIPRFILIDKDGNIVNAEAPKPSDPKLIELLDSLPL